MPTQNETCQSMVGVCEKLCEKAEDCESGKRRIIELADKYHRERASWCRNCGGALPPGLTICYSCLKGLQG